MKDSTKAFVNKAIRNFFVILLVGGILLFPSFVIDENNKWYSYYREIIGSIVAVGIALFVVNKEFVDNRRLLKEDYNSALKIEQRRCCLEDIGTLSYYAALLTQDFVYLNSIMESPETSRLIAYNLSNPNSIPENTYQQFLKHFDYIANKAPIGIIPDREDIRNIRLNNNSRIQSEIIHQLSFIRTLRDMFYKRTERLSSHKDVYTAFMWLQSAAKEDRGTAIHRLLQDIGIEIGINQIQIKAIDGELPAVEE